MRSLTFLVLLCLTGGASGQNRPLFDNPKGPIGPPASLRDLEALPLLNQMLAQRLGTPPRPLPAATDIVNAHRSNSPDTGYVSGQGWRLDGFKFTVQDVLGVECQYRLRLPLEEAANLLRNPGVLAVVYQMRSFIISGNYRGNYAGIGASRSVRNAAGRIVADSAPELQGLGIVTAISPLGEVRYYNLSPLTRETNLSEKAQIIAAMASLHRRDRVFPTPVPVLPGWQSCAADDFIGRTSASGSGYAIRDVARYIDMPNERYLEALIITTKVIAPPDKDKPAEEKPADPEPASPPK